MRILYILPGSGSSFYCQNCLRDLAVAEALRTRGHAVTLMPLYLPSTARAPAPDDVPVFYGAVTLYLRHTSALLRRLPRRWFAPLDRWPVLRLAARMAGTTSARGLEDLTLSMLRGPGGRQADELRLVADWIAGLPAEEKPDVIVLSTALLAGLAETLGRTAACPVVCWLQDEHVWFDAMAPDLRAAVLRVMADDARHIQTFVAVSAAYAQRMAGWLSVPADRIGVVFPGLDPAAYRPADVSRRPATVGFLSRLSAEEGFDRFVEAFILLRRDPRFRDARCSATGGPSTDRHFLRRQMRRLADAGAADAARIDPARFASDRIGFLSELSLLAVPGGASPEAFGYQAIEALAAGLPVVLPAHGAFPEIAAAAGCGVLAPDNDPATLAAAWADLLADPRRLRDEASRGRAAARTRFSQAACAAGLERVLSKQVRPPFPAT